MIQEKRENFMFTNDTIFYKKLLGLMLPMMLQNLMLALVAVADAFMLGGMDQNYMSAVSLATQIQFIQNMLLSAATGGLAILGAQYWGRGNIKTLDDIFCMALRLCGLVSIAFFIACICFPQYLMLFFTDEPVLIGYGVQYLRIAGFSYLLTGISQCYLVVMKISEHALTTALISSATVGINIALNAILIYGKLGITPMRRRNRPFSGRCSPGRPSHLGPPTAPSSTQSAARHLSSSCWGIAKVSGISLRFQYC